MEIVPRWWRATFALALGRSPTARPFASWTGVAILALNRRRGTGVPEWAWALRVMLGCARSWTRRGGTCQKWRERADGPQVLGVPP